MAVVSPPMTIEGFTLGYNRNLTEVVRNVYTGAVREFDQIAKVEDTARIFDEYQSIQGMPKPSLNRDLQPLPQIVPVTGYKTTIRQLTYRAQLTVEETLIRTADHRQIYDNMQDMVESVKTLKDAAVANFFNNGFTNSLSTNITEQDGVARAPFSTGHVYENGVGTFSNYYNVLVPPNPETVFTIIEQYLRRLSDNAGNFIAWDNEFTIITPTLVPSWGLAAEELVQSMDRPDTTNRATNVVNKNFRLKHISLNNLTSTTKWFIIVSSTHRAYPLVMRQLLDLEITPLEKIGPANPHCLVQTERTQFGIGWRGSYRGIVAIGT